MYAAILENGRWGDVAGNEIADQNELRMLTPMEMAILIKNGEMDSLYHGSGYFSV